MIGAGDALLIRLTAKLVVLQRENLPSFAFAVRMALPLEGRWSRRGNVAAIRLARSGG